MISFVIPSYNRNSYLKQLLNSILSQDYKDIEIVVIDDNSTDQTEETMNEYVQKYPFIVYHKNTSNKGCGYNRGLGIKKTKGEYVIFADDDDFYTNNSFLSKGIEVFEQYPNLAFVSANAEIQLENTGQTSIGVQPITGYIDQRDYFGKFNLEYGRPLSTFPTIFRREALLSAEIELMVMVNDASIYLRSLLYGDVYIMDDIVGVYRIHNSNITKSLTADFITQNLDEKKYVYNKAVVAGIVNNRGWMRKHFMLTISYYFRSSKPDVSDLFKVLNWGAVNGISNIKMAVVKDFFIGKARHLYRKIQV
jgi:glycosyltransferase involved in cell wall biosynthesis